MKNFIKKIKITNYKCFEEHIINFENLSIVIGRNNAGKSTLVEALRIISLSIEKMKRTLSYRNAPTWTNLGIGIIGILPTLREIDVEFENDSIFYDYKIHPIIIEAFFEQKIVIKVIINKVSADYKVFVSAYDGRKNIKSKSVFLSLDIASVHVLPQITPLQDNERIVTDATLYGNRFSRKISRNFRTHIYKSQYTDNFIKFKQLIEDSWTQIQINEVYKEDEFIYLNVRDGAFTAEVYRMGHGLQMWLQIMWFISGIMPNDIIILDEPDVYMHPDLQKKLIRILRKLSVQIIIATHSLEIVSEVEPRNILIINRDENETNSADNIPAVQAALQNIGSVHNFNLARLLDCKKYLYVEGKDVQILKRLHNILFPNSHLPLDIIPSAPTNGWTGWNLQKENAKRLKSELPDSEIYFIFDRDYHFDDEINTRIHEAKSLKLKLYVWGRKEIENYLINSKPISRIIKLKNKDLSITDIETEISEFLNNQCDEMKEDALDKCINDYKESNPRYDYGRCRKSVTPIFEMRWKKDKFGVVSGKEFISKLNTKFQKKYNVSFSANALANAYKENEIHDEMKRVLTFIENE